MVAEIIVFISVLIGVAAGAVFERVRNRVESAEPGTALVPVSAPMPANRRSGQPGWLRANLLAAPRPDSAEQLRHVAGADFNSRRLLSVSEERVLEALEIIIADMALGWRVMAQVNLAEILDTPDDSAFRAISAKRVDLLIVSAAQMPIAAVEYQGHGHFQGDAAVNDAIKREALRRAGIAYVEVMADDTPAELRDQLRRLAARQRLHGDDATLPEAMSVAAPAAEPIVPVPVTTKPAEPLFRPEPLFSPEVGGAAAMPA